MNYRFSRLLNKGFWTVCMAVACGGFTACSDDYDLDDEGNYPSWLGQSIYEELKDPNPEHLTGTFNTYLRLVEDLDYKETLSRTGSKTVFPANDEAFQRFFASNSWGVSSYEELTDQQKRQLLYSSMLDNAILVEMLSNVSNSDGTGVDDGVSLKHTTGANVIDGITHFYSRGELPANNRYWDRFTNGLDMVMDGTRPMMVHFTGPQLIQNDITTTGENSDFKVITGDDYTENAAYIFRDKIINQDITCQNGYIHQVKDVLVPPGSIAELIRTNGESDYFSRMLDRFSAPFYDASTTVNYNDYAQVNGLPLIDSVFQKRYFSTRSQGSSSSAPFTIDPNGNAVSYSLAYDPGWNGYTNGYSGTNPYSDICAMFVPTDTAMIDYFVNGGTGRTIIERYGSKPNTPENLAENLDSIPINIVQTFVRDLMKPSFVDAVPSKFGNVVHDGSGDPMGVTLADLNTNTDGSYDVKIGDNGVAYMLNRVIVPDEWASVLGPVLHSNDKLVFYYLTQLGKTGTSTSSPLNINFYAYLLAMSSNYGLFVPTDAAFDKMYIDPASLGHTNNAQRAVHFYLNKNSAYNFSASTWTYNPTNGEMGDSTKLADADNSAGLRAVISQIKDILNTHTVVLAKGQTMGEDRYYLTKNGCAIEIDGNTVRSGAQIDGDRPASNIAERSRQTNGTTYIIDHIIEAPTTSVWKTLNNNSDRFSEFINLCTGAALNSEYDWSQMLNFAGISTRTDATTHSNPSNAYRVFTAEDNSANSGLDRNVYFFNSFNYTVYAPNNEAVQKAYDAGLPSWDDVAEVMAEAEALEEGSQHDELYKQAQDKALAMIDEINEFVRYHFQDNSIFADKSAINGQYATACSNELGVHVDIQVNRENDKITVTDAGGREVTIERGSQDLLVNKMARDMVFDAGRVAASAISTSSFAVIHEINTPLCRNTDFDFGAWKTQAGAKRLANIARAKMKLRR